ncbi:MAG: hypothetical protein H6Q86_3971 [candidate division NC10 bacterium]|nr:hypothetical protein [candidate division NC10 bacterium]
MRLKDESRRLVIRNSPRLHWIPGVLLAAAGGFALLVAAGLAGDGRTYTIAVRVAAGLLGGLALALGAWVCWRGPLSTVVVDRVGRAVTLTRRGFFRTVAEQYPADAIVDVRVKKERGGKGSPLYRVEFLLDSGSVVPVSLIRPNDRDGCMRAAEHLWKALGLPRT